MPCAWSIPTVGALGNDTKDGLRICIASISGTCLKCKAHKMSRTLAYTSQSRENRNMFLWLILAKGTHLHRKNNVCGELGMHRLEMAEPQCGNSLDSKITV